jgi:hypothetical protein
MLLGKLQNLSRRYQAADSAEMRRLLGKSLGSYLLEYDCLTSLHKLT